MGSDVENVAGAKLKREAQTYDYYDAESQTGIQLKGTRQTSSPEELKGGGKGAIKDLETDPPKLSTFYRNGEPVDIVRANIKIRAVVVAIPSTPVSWNFQAFIQQMEQLEETEKVIIKIVPTRGLD